MTLQFFTLSTILVLSYPINVRPVNNEAQAFTTNDDTTSNFTFEIAIAQEDSSLHRYEQKHNLGVIKTCNSPKLMTETSTTDVSDILSSDLKSANVSFKEKKREDAFEKRPATESPHAVLLLILIGLGKGSAICSGSLLTPDWVLTAAHCLSVPKDHVIRDVIVYAGGNSANEVKSDKLASGSQVRYSRMFLPHPKYKGGDYDIGLVHVNESFNLTDTVNTVEISTQPWNHRGYRQCQLTGFGIVQMGEQRADDKVSRYICARPRQDYGVCPGDSGGGLLCDGKVRGVAMQIVQLLEMSTCQIQVIPDMQCGSPSALSIFQDTCPFLPWINSHVRLFNDSQIAGECADRGTASGPLRGGAPHLLPLVLVTFIINTTMSTSYFVVHFYYELTKTR